MSGLETIVAQTSLGPVPLWGAFAGFDPAKPLIFAIRGAFPDPDHMTLLPGRVPEADVVLAHLPGMHTPHLSETSVGAFAQAFDEVLATRFTDRRILVFGLSIGGLAALAMRAGDAVLALDPPLSTADLWPMTPRLRQARADDPAMADWIWNIFGLDGERLENRDYRPLLAANTRPGYILIGGEPLEPPRPFTRLPGLMSAEDRALAAAHPTLKAIIVAGCGHNIPTDAPGALMDALTRGLALLLAARP